MLGQVLPQLQSFIEENCTGESKVTRTERSVTEIFRCSPSPDTRDHLQPLHWRPADGRLRPGEPPGRGLSALQRRRPRGGEPQVLPGVSGPAPRDGDGFQNKDWRDGGSDEEVSSHGGAGSDQG